MKSLSNWLAYIEGFHPKGQGGIELGLDRISRVRDTLKQARFCPLIVVGGTNGKGSTCAYLEAIHSLSGYRVGCYTSPHLDVYNDRIRVCRRGVDDATLCRAFARVENARKAAGDVFLTYFEFGTLAAWEVFSEARLDVVVLEVGLGGRLDAVNLYDSDAAIVTGVALDHTDWLGTTRESIAFEKAGIFRLGKPAICADFDPPRTLVDEAAARGAELRRIGRDFGFGYREKTGHWDFWRRDIARSGVPFRRLSGLDAPALRGRCQLGNAAAALEAVAALEDRLPVPESALRRGLSEIDLPGRFQVLPGRPVVVLDVAHNPQAASVLAENLREMGSFEKTFAVVGMLEDKDIAGVLRALAQEVDFWLPVSLDVPRGASASVLARFLESLGGEVLHADSPEDAFFRAIGQAGENDRILIFGSFFTVAPVLRATRPSK
ncbi:MAG: bifunctional tetrahydrofolate synthase/dihydrofolate synthase [Candidatus Accumulibacter sp.]|jgi:dihydrofolate synthase/folylpolyglutamate synthase|nr:bifunctional tetrahydrofolate synthase/dihydrofolate synthase [Accumulibacter sp.]